MIPTCQASCITFPPGMALGYADRDAIVNTFIIERMALEEFVTFVEEVKGD